MFDADYLGKKGYYWGEISQKEANRFVDMARTKGYRVAIDQLDIRHPGMREYITSFSRSDWIFSCSDFSSGQKCLDIGSGWGAITFSLAEHFDEVWSMESVYERLKFQQIRAEQEQRKNIRFIRSDWLKLPFSDNSFDLVVVNGVLEWIGLSDMSKSPRLLQLQFLSEIHRVLKPGGRIYIGIENRFAFFLFLGSLDHSGLPFTSLVPRFIADWIIRMFRHVDERFDDVKRMSLKWPNYRTYTYTKWGYQQLLREVGFTDFEFNWTLAYNSPTETGRFDGESFKYLLSLFRQHDFSVTITSRLATFLSPLTPRAIVKLFLPIFGPSFLIFASKNQTKMTFEAKLLRKVGKGATSFIKRSGTHGIISKINYIFLKDGIPTHIAKFSRFTKYQKHLIKEEKLLGKFNNIDIREYEIDGRKIFVEPFIRGNICQTLSYSDNIKVIKWLISFKKEHTGKKISKKDMYKIINDLNRFLELTSGLPKEIVAFAKSKLIEFADKLIDYGACWTTEHGDFVKTNIILDAKGRIRVLDWEFYEPNGIPAWDILTFLINNARVGHMPKIFTDNFMGRGRYSEILKQSWRYYTQEMQLPVDIIESGIWYVLVRGYYKRFSDPWGRHLDSKPFVELISLWYKIGKESTLWISSK